MTSQLSFIIERRTIGIYTLSPWSNLIVTCVYCLVLVFNKTCHKLLKYWQTIEKSDHIRHTYLKGSSKYMFYGMCTSL